MIERQTVLVLGAGASVPFGFPTGRELVTKVVAGLRKETAQLFQLLQGCGFKAADIAAFRDALATSGRSSVDRFLEFRQEFVDIGKTAIAATLIPFEVDADLFDGGPSWCEYVWQRLGSLDEIARGQLSVITFNYDRSFDQYVLTALQSGFGIPPERAAQYVQRAIPIVHVYGQLGGLPLLDGRGARPYEPADPARAAAVAFAAKDGIQIMHEGAADNLALGRAAQLIQEAEVICFLGFGYLAENLDRLRVDDRRADAVVWGSAHGVGEGDKDAVRRFFTRATGKRDILLGTANQDALEFLRQHTVFA